MESTEQRATSYARDCRLQGQEAKRAMIDYIAGAQEERILLTQWRKLSEAKNFGHSKHYLVRIERPILTNEYRYAIATSVYGKLVIHDDYMKLHINDVEYQEINE